MSVAEQVTAHLPYLRRFARAVTGSQKSGDAYVVSTLEAILADSSVFSRDLPPRVALYRTFLKILGSIKWNNEKQADAVAPGLEDRLLSSVVRTDQGAVLALAPDQAQSIASRIAKALEQALAQPVLLCSPSLRPHLYRLFARVLPHLGVLSHNEVPPHVPIVPLATLD